MTRRSFLFPVLAALLLALAPGLTPARAQEAQSQFFRIGTGPTSGSYFPLGALLASAISNPPGSRDCDKGGSCGVPGLIAVAISTDGSVENIEQIKEGGLDSGLVGADIAYDAYHGIGPFKGKGPGKGAVTDLRAIAALFAETLHVVVRQDSGITSITQLKGKRVAVGPRASGAEFHADAVLAAYGLSEKAIKPVYVRPGEASDMLAQGKIDAYLTLLADPSPTLAELADRLPIRLLPVSTARAAQIARKSPFFSPSGIPGGLYRNVDKAVPSVGIRALWVTSTAVTQSRVHAIAAALWHRSNQHLLDSNPVGRTLRRSEAVTDLPIPLHKGAADYYFDAGLIH